MLDAADTCPQSFYINLHIVGSWRDSADSKSDLKSSLIGLLYELCLNSCYGIP